MAVDSPAGSRAALDLVRQLAAEGETKVQVLHLRERELSGPAWFSRESRRDASYASCRYLCGAEEPGQAVMVSVWCPAVVGIVTSVPRFVWRT